MSGHKYQKGHKKFEGSGMQKGMKHKATSAREAMEAAGCDPVQAIINIAEDPKNKIELRAKMYVELLQYLFPKLRAIEHTGVGGAPIGIQVSASEELARRIDALSERLTPKVKM